MTKKQDAPAPMPGPGLHWFASAAAARKQLVGWKRHVPGEWFTPADIAALSPRQFFVLREHGLIVQKETGPDDPYVPPKPYFPAPPAVTVLRPAAPPRVDPWTGEQILDPGGMDGTLMVPTGVIRGGQPK